MVDVRSGQNQGAAGECTVNFWNIGKVVAIHHRWIKQTYIVKLDTGVRSWSSKPESIWSDAIARRRTRKLDQIGEICKGVGYGCNEGKMHREVVYEERNAFVSVCGNRGTIAATGPKTKAFWRFEEIRDNMEKWNWNLKMCWIKWIT